ncbi:Fe2+-enterobactin ABC transporter substrate-binding protein [Microbacterium sp. TNHR37B]|uniref:Fe2+-enterobactin ABC transporter substrate-binding protein n=1 Tax=Microbacterium sp. TNHR37B TaxID=1775956 RepID=UPI0007B1EF6A|nr:Fe2+-enterobactin ABC transporter substrate-binding protein [Microbacterium sp. TNHR37B]KZE91883.1 Ferrienterobactin-binding periplasmic protein [Microbacterium sp. TNHR37B]
MTTLRLRAFGTASLALAAALALSACTGAPAPASSDSPPSSADEGAGWPRTFDNADGSTTEIPAAPQRVLSTAVSVTGTLLALDAPVIASGTSTGGAWFDQWAGIAEERDVDPIWEVGSFDLEAVIAADPDLIVVATSGRDALLDQVEALRDVAPTIVVDYGGQTWQDLADELGEATGREAEADAVEESFDALVDDVAEEIAVPAGTANIISFNGAGQDNPIARKGGAQAKLLADLGFTIEDPDPAWHTQAQQREDFVWAPYENLTRLTSETTFILSADDATAQRFAEDPVMANVPSVRAGQVYGLGVNSFRMDPYSATEIVEGVRAAFAP